jgi:hypothetical protein
VAILFRNISLTEQAIFCNEGEYWTMAYGGKAFRLNQYHRSTRASPKMAGCLM